MQLVRLGSVSVLGLALACGGVSQGGGADSSSKNPGTAGKNGASQPTSGTGGVPDRDVEMAVGGEVAAGTAAVGGGNAAGGSGTAGAADGGLADGDVRKSSGCGKALPAQQVLTVPGSRTGYTEWSVTATGATLTDDVPADTGPRQFFVRVPIDYDPNRPYRVVYIGSGCGAQHAGKTNTFPLFNEAQGGSEQAIYVGMSVPDNAANPGCYDNNTGPLSQDWESFDLMHSFVEQTYCVDNNRIYVAGYSTGAWIANMWGCYFAGTPSPPLDEPDIAAGRTERKFAPHWAIRGHLGVAGSLPPNQPQPCNGPAAGFWLHDMFDKSNLIATSIAALNLSLKSNGCTGTYEDGPKQPWAPAENILGLQGGICQQYTGCPAEVSEKYPLVFCTTAGLGHGDQSTNAIPAFTAFMNLLDPAP